MAKNVYQSIDIDSTILNGSWSILKIQFGFFIVNIRNNKYFIWCGCQSHAQSWTKKFRKIFIRTSYPWLMQIINIWREFKIREIKYMRDKRSNSNIHQLEVVFSYGAVRHSLRSTFRYLWYNPKYKVNVDCYSDHSWLAFQ